MAATVTRKKSDLAAFQRSQYVCVGWSAKWRVQRNLMHLAEAGHGVQTATANDADFRLLQTKLLGEVVQTNDYTRKAG